MVPGYQYRGTVCTYDNNIIMMYSLASVSRGNDDNDYNNDNDKKSHDKVPAGTIQYHTIQYHSIPY